MLLQSAFIHFLTKLSNIPHNMAVSNAKAETYNQSVSYCISQKVSAGLVMLLEERQQQKKKWYFEMKTETFRTGIGLLRF